MCSLLAVSRIDIWRIHGMFAPIKKPREESRGLGGNFVGLKLYFPGILPPRRGGPPSDYFFLFSPISAAWAAARRAIGTRKGEQLT